MIYLWTRLRSQGNTNIMTDSAHPAAVIESSLIFSLLDIVDYMSLVSSHHGAIGTYVTSSIVILAVLFPLTITGIALYIIVLLSSQVLQGHLNFYRLQIKKQELKKLHMMNRKSITAITVTYTKYCNQPKRKTKNSIWYSLRSQQFARQPLRYTVNCAPKLAVLAKVFDASFDRKHEARCARRTIWCSLRSHTDK